MSLIEEVEVSVSRHDRQCEAQPGDPQTEPVLPAHQIELSDHNLFLAFGELFFEESLIAHGRDVKDAFEDFGQKGRLLNSYIGLDPLDLGPFFDRSQVNEQTKQKHREVEGGQNRLDNAAKENGKSGEEAEVVHGTAERVREAQIQRVQIRGNFGPVKSLRQTGHHLVLISIEEPSDLNLRNCLRVDRVTSCLLLSRSLFWRCSPRSEARRTWE
jgi:hypothetical protein